MLNTVFHLVIKVHYIMLCEKIWIKIIDYQKDNRTEDEAMTSFVTDKSNNDFFLITSCNTNQKKNELIM